jgi:F0F1-type ATP synthase assembly protein I
MPADIANAEIDSSGSDSETDISPQENPQPRSGTPALVGITQQESDIELLPENGVAIGFVEGYSWDDFGMDSTDAICLVPIGTPIDSDGNIQISVKNSEAVTLAVAGIVYGGNPDKIYCPWRYLINTFEGGMEWSQSFRATIIDNKRLAEIKEKMKTAFTYADPMHPGTEYSYAMTIFDSQYMSSHKSVSQNIALLTAAQPIFLIIDIIIGFMTGFLLLRQRRKEYALFRAIGCGKAGAISLLLLEYTIICIFSAAIYSVSAIFITAVQSGFAYLPFVIICFIMGIFAAEIVIMRDSALKSLQTNE